MKVTFHRPTLLASLKALVRFVPSHLGDKPVQQFVRIEVTEDHVNLTVNNLDGGMTVTLWDRGFGDDNPVILDGSMGACLLAAKLWREIVQKVAGDHLTLSFEPGAPDASLKAGKSAFNLHAAIVSEFLSWDMSRETGLSTVEITARELRRALDAVVYATAKSAARPLLQGVHMGLHPDRGLRLEATDSHRLVRTVVQPRNMAAGQATDGVIPAESLEAVAANLPDDPDEMVMWEMGSALSRLTWSDGDTRIIVRKLEGNFPDTDRIIPTEFPGGHVTIKREALVALCERTLMVCAGVENQWGVFEFTAEGLRVCAKAPGIGKIEDRLETDGSLDRTVALNVRFLADAVKALPGDTVHLLFRPGAREPVVLRDQEASVTALVLPVVTTPAATDAETSEKQSA